MCFINRIGCIHAIKGVVKKHLIPKIASHRLPTYRGGAHQKFFRWSLLISQLKLKSNVLCRWPFNPKGCRFCEENFLRYLDSCYVNPAYHKLNTFPPLWDVNQSEASRFFFAKPAAIGVGGKGYFAAVGTYSSSWLLINYFSTYLLALSRLFSQFWFQMWTTCSEVFSSVRSNKSVCSTGFL